MNADLTPSSLAISILTSQTFFDILLKVIIYFWGFIYPQKIKRFRRFHMMNDFRTFSKILNFLRM